MAEDRNEQDEQTLFVRGISEEVDEEILFELFQNAGPLVKVNIPIDNVTKRKKQFCFVQFQHAESVPYAIDLFKDVRLFGRSLTMQNRSTGAGIHPQKDQNQASSHQHQRTMSLPVAGQFHPPFQQGLAPNPFNNQMLIQQQYLMQQQQQQQHQQPPQFNRQFSDNSHDSYNRGSRNQYHQQGHQNYDQNYQQDRRHQREDRPQNNYQSEHQQSYDRRQQSHHREDRSRTAYDRHHPQGNDFRDRSNDRRSYDNRNNSSQNRRRY